jgi:uncharacterized protein with PQ loop repeat
MVPIETSLMMLVLWQRFYYDGFKISPLFSYSIIASFMFAAGMLVLNVWYPGYVITFIGWAAFVVFSCNPIPQLIKIIREKATYGFSFGFASFTALAQVIELVCGIIEKVPVPTLVTAARGVIVYLWYCYLFYRYSAKR